MTISLKAFIKNMSSRENADTAIRLSSALIEDLHDLCVASSVKKGIIVDKIGVPLLKGLLPKYTKEIEKSFVFPPQTNEEDENVG